MQGIFLKNQQQRGKKQQPSPVYYPCSPNSQEGDSQKKQPFYKSAKGIPFSFRKKKTHCTLYGPAPIQGKNREQIECGLHQPAQRDPREPSAKEQQQEAPDRPGKGTEKLLGCCQSCHGDPGTSCSDLNPHNPPSRQKNPQKMKQLMDHCGSQGGQKPVQRQRKKQQCRQKVCR